ncbi:MAG: iron(III) transport system substrate-binding protein [Gammaproteobacteria bacterium]|jgi:ABC-type Fe3+ transport system substrate-binding protein|nr:iron(III) transport system substrate-binding protein [Gammaproteobacteria bacterium]
MKAWSTRVLLVLVLLVLFLPFMFRAFTTRNPPVVVRAGPADQLVIMTPHLETVRRKFEKAFSAWYAANYHRGVSIEYLSYGGGEIVKFFQASEAAYKRSGTYNIDVVWGGSDSLFSDALGSKYLDKVALDPAVLAAAFPTPDIGGVPLYDPDPVAGPRWFGAALSSFGILYNRDVLAYLHLPEPRTWADLADPRYRGWLELADPTRSASAKAALQVIVEREMETASQENRPQQEAWARGMGLIRQIAANAKGFTQAANELPSTVSNGDVAAAMSIDFYARAQIAAVGGGRVSYVEPQGATMVTPEPIALVRGAQHAEVARRFIEFILSDAGQRLWITKPGPGESPEMALQRLPIVRSVYDNPVNFTEFTNPYTTAGGFNTKPSRRAAFGLMDELIALCCIDLLPELRETRKQIVESPRRSELDAKLGTFPVDQAASQAGVDVHRQMLRGKPEDWLTLQRRWREQFRAEYRELRREATP